VFVPEHAPEADATAQRRRAQLRRLTAEAEQQPQLPEERTTEEATPPTADPFDAEAQPHEAIFHRKALQQLIRIVCDQPDGEALMRHAMTDDSVRALFERYRLIRRSSEARVREAINGLTPTMGLHGGGVRLAGVEASVALLVLDGTCNGCSFSRIQLHKQLEIAILAAAPELTGIELLTTTAANDKNTLTTMGHHRAKAHGWIQGPPVAVFDGTAAHHLELKGKGHTRTLVVQRHRDRHVVFPAHCPDHRADLAWLSATETIGCPNGCEYSHTGEALHAPRPTLEVLPTRVENERLWVLALQPKPANTSTD
jgi:Fe-S cluster biogenesis protein NfuA/nitrite reductase/ring-hydroxylating ferredoxin subunit